MAVLSIIQHQVGILVLPGWCWSRHSGARLLGFDACWSTGAADSSSMMCCLPLWSPLITGCWIHFQLSFWHISFSNEPHFTIFFKSFWSLISAGLIYIYIYFECPAFLAPSSPAMIGVNSLHSAGRLRSRSLCTVRYGRDFRMMDPFRYPRTPRSRSLKPLVFPDLLGKAQDGQNHPQARKRRKVLKTVLHVICHC